MNDKKEKVILVNEKDELIGTEEKMKVHLEGRLHRAFSIFVFNSEGQLLLQKRADSKYHSPSLWSNSACSHPRPKESILKAAQRRLQEEMGFSCQVKEKYKFHYNVEFNNGLIENEIDYILTGVYNGNININKEEVSDYKWISIKNLIKEIENNGGQYTVWLKIAIKKYFKNNTNFL